MTKRERLEAAIAGEVADRPPVALWRHFPVADQDPATLSEATVAWQEAYDFDFVKVTPASSFCLRDWGVQDEWRGDTEGTRQYTRRVIQDPKDWDSLQRLDPGVGSLGSQVRCLELIREGLGAEIPYVQTIFSPLAQAKNLAGEARLLEHLHRSPKQVAEGLETITQTTIGFVEAARRAGVAGIFYAIQHASYRFFDHDAYSRFGELYDRRILEAADTMWLNVLHLHGESLIFEVAERLPAQVVNWHDRKAGPDLGEAGSRLSGAVCGGLRRWETLVLGDPEAVRREGQEALGALGGRGVILGAGCVVPVVAPRANLLAARRVADCA